MCVRPLEMSLPASCLLGLGPTWGLAPLLLFSFVGSGASMLTLRLLMLCKLRASADAFLSSESSGDVGLQLATIYKNAVL